MSQENMGIFQLEDKSHIKIKFELFKISAEMFYEKPFTCWKIQMKKRDKNCQSKKGEVQAI